MHPLTILPYLTRLIILQMWPQVNTFRPVFGAIPQQKGPHSFRAKPLACHPFAGSGQALNEVKGPGRTKPIDLLGDWAYNVAS